MSFNENKFNQAVELLTSEGVSEEEIFKKLEGASDDELNKFSLEMLGDNMAAVNRGEMQFEQDEQDIAEAGGRSLIPNVEEEERFNSMPTGGETFIASAVSKSSGTLVDRAVGDEYRDLLKTAREEHFFAGIGGDIVGYMLSPAGRIVRGMNIGGGASPVLAMAAEVLAVESTEALVDVVHAGMKNPSKIKEAIISNAGELAFETAATMVGGKLLTGAVAPLKSLAKATSKTTKKWMGLVGTNLGDEATDILMNLDDIVREGPEALSLKTAEVLDKAKTAAQAQYAEAAKTGSKQAMQAAEAVSAQIDSYAADLVKGLSNPKSSIQALVGLSDDLAVAGNAASARYGQGLDSLAKMTDGKTFKIADSMDELLKVFEYEGAITRQGKQIIAGGKDTKFPAALEYIKKISTKGEITHGELGTLVRVLQPAAGKAVKEGASDADKLAFKLLGKYRAELTNPSLWGDDVAIMTNDLLTEYKAGKDIMFSIKGALTKTKQGINSIGRDEGSYMEAAEQIYKNLDIAQKGTEKLKGLKSFYGAVDDSVQKKINLGLQESRKLIDYTRATDVKVARQTLKNVFNGKFNPAKDSETLKLAFESYSKQYELELLLGAQHKAIPQIEKALKNPLSEGIRTSAEKFTKTYAKGVTPELKKTLASLGKWRRLAGSTSKDMSKINNVRNALQDIVDPTELLETQMMLEFVPDAEKLIQQMDLEKLIKKADPRLSKYFTLKGGTWLEGLMVVNGGPFGAAAVALKRMASDPVALRLLSSELAGKPLNIAQIQAVAQGAKLIGILSDELISNRSDEYSDPQQR